MRILSIFALLISQISSFNETIARRNLKITAATYCDFRDWTCITCIPDVSLIDYIIGDTNIIIARDKVQNATVFAFRGSSDIENWISNFELRQISPYMDTNIKVHRGLYNEYSKYKDWLFDRLPKTGDVVITGHSSGGALAMFFAYESANLLSKPSVYTFGKPRIGNTAFVDSVNTTIQHYRITHHNDIVPHLPEELLNYRHTNTEIWYSGDDGQYRVCETNEDNDCSNSCAPLHCDSVSDHKFYMMTNIGSEYC